MAEITDWKWFGVNDWGTQWICPTCENVRVVNHYWQLPTTCPKCNGAEIRPRQSEIKHAMGLIDEICSVYDIEITSEDWQSLTVVKDNRNEDEYFYEDGRLRWK